MDEKNAILKYLFCGVKTVGLPKSGSQRMSCTDARNMAKKWYQKWSVGRENAKKVLMCNLVGSFSRIFRLYACYRAKLAPSGVIPGSGQGYGTEFVFAGSEQDLCVYIVDPRSTHVTELPMETFMTRGAAYWEEYPRGWATSLSLLPMPPDCKRSLLSRMTSNSPESYRSLANALRRYLEPGAGMNASMSPRALFLMCKTLTKVAFELSGTEYAAAPLFHVLETQKCRSLIAWKDGVQPPGFIEAGKVKAPLRDALYVVIAELKTFFFKWAMSISVEKLLHVDSTLTFDIEKARAKERRRRLSSMDSVGEVPLCISRCVYPRSKDYPKNEWRYLVVSAINEMSRKQSIPWTDLIDEELMKVQWKANGSASGLSSLAYGLKRGKVYSSTCQAVDSAGGCPHAGDVKKCCSLLGKPLPSFDDLTPASVWLSSPNPPKKIKD